MQKPTTQEVQAITPTASVTAEVNQTAAGAWRGTVKVNVTAPITFVSRFFPDREYETVFTEHEGMAEIAEADGKNVEYSIRPMINLDDQGEKPAALVLAPTIEEYQIRESMVRLLAQAGAMVRATVDFYNGQDGTLEVKVKK